MKLSKHEKELAEKYKDVITNTGGNDIVELVEREGVNFQNNYIVAALQIACMAQISCLSLLEKKGMLK